MEREVGCQGRELELGEGRSSETRLGLTPPEHQSQLFPTDLREVQADGKGSPPPACMVWCGVVWRDMAPGTHVHGMCQAS